MEHKYETFTEKENFSYVFDKSEDNSQPKNNLQIYVKLENEKQNIENEKN